MNKSTVFGSDDVAEWDALNRFFVYFQNGKYEYETILPGESLEVNETQITVISDIRPTPYKIDDCQLIQSDIQSRKEAKQLIDQLDEVIGVMNK